MNVDAIVDNLKYYVGMSSILESRNPPILSRHVSSLTMSNFDAYRQRLMNQHWPHSLLIMRRQWMTFVMGALEDVPLHFKRVSPNP